jgi:hypothetical protein
VNHLSGADVGIADGNGTDGWRTVARYNSHDDAQRAVDHLAAMNFPIEHTEIVGRDLRSVERLTDPMNATVGAYAGAALGAWIGLLTGVLVGLVISGPVSPVLILGGAAIGAFCGALIGRIARGAVARQHNLAAARRLVAGHYELMVIDAHAERARVTLAQTR